MFRIILKTIGPNRLKVLSKVAATLGISRAQAKEMVDAGDATIGFGDCSQAARLIDQYEDLGATVDDEMWPEGMMPETWAIGFSNDGVTCPCGTLLFFNVPGETTIEEIRAFDASSPLVKAGHPGAYCGTCGRYVMVNFGVPRMWTKRR